MAKSLIRRMVGMLAGLAVMFAGLVAAAPAAQAATFKVSVGVSARETAVGGRVTITGKVTGKTSKKTVQIQRRYAGSSKWSKIATVKLDKSSRYSYTATMTDDRDRYYRVYKPAEKKLKKKYSSSVKIVVYRASATTETLAFASSTVSDPTMSACATPVASVVGVPGSITRMYRDGRLWQTKRVEPVTQVTTVGASTAPCATSVTPTQGPAAGGQVVTITGRNLGGEVRFGDTAASVTSASETEIVAEAPALDGGSYPVRVNGQSVGEFQAVVPARIDSISPASGSFSGGETVTITGAGFTSASQVTFTPVIPEKYFWSTVSGDGTMPASPAKFTVVSDTKISVVVPPGIATQTTVKVLTESKTAATTYTYSLVWREPSEVDTAFLETMNDYRARGYNCDTGYFDRPAAGPVVWDGYLADLAMSHSRDMNYRNAEYRALSLRDYGSKHRLSHSSPGLNSDGYKARVPLAKSQAWLENIGGGAEYSNSPIDVEPFDAFYAILQVEGFSRSWGHCMAMMEPLVTKVGTGFDAANIDKSGNPSPYHISKYVTVEMGPVPGA